MPGKKRGNFSPEFKEEAARMVVDTSRSIAEVARELGLNGTTLGYWVKHTGKATPATSRSSGYRTGHGYVNWNAGTVSWKWRTRS